MPDYTQGKIYRLTVGEHFYIGSTTTSLNQRLCNHKQLAGRMPSRLYQAMGEIPNATIELIMDFPCDDRAALAECEDIFIQRYRTNPLCLNQRSGCITPEEKLNYHKNYREQIRLCSCGTSVTAGNFATHQKSQKHSGLLGID